MPSLDTLREIIDLELASALPRVGKFGHGVLVGPISAAIGLNLDVLYLVGLSEDTYPGRIREDALLPETARAALPDELSSNRESLHARYRALLAAMSSAPKVVATFPRGDLRRSSQRLPSRFLLPSLRELSGNKALPATEWEEANYGTSIATSGSFAGELLTTRVIATEQEWRTRAAIADQLEDQSVTAAHELLEARRGSDFTRFDGNLKGLDGLPSYATSDRLISPTALESYASCPHAFFVKRLLGVEPIEQPEDSVSISPADVGNLIHESFDALVTEFAESLPAAGLPWSAAQRARLMEIVDTKARTFEDRGLTGHPTLWERERLRITGVLINMLDVDDAWRAETNTAVRASELPFGQKDYKPVEIVIPSGRVLMRGSADKVDVATDGTIYVTDIKTGSKRAFKEITQDAPTVGGTKLQLPVYAYAAREVFGDRATPVVTAYWFVGRDQGRIEIDMTPDVEAQYAATLDVIVRSIANGKFPAKAPDVPDFAWVQCPYCNPDGVGHGEVRDQWDAKRHDSSLHELVGLIEPSAIDSGDPV
jgi:ATP-dependent helicase/DNAse subunit B